jgi:tRNA(Arg) A34 adenosine deaminase TadA
MIPKTLELATQSNMQKRIGCIITDKRGRPISFGVNKKKTHPLQEHYAKQAMFPKKLYLHAEIAALVKCRDQGHTIWVGRLLQNGTPALARPCPICLAAIKESGIKVIMYTDNNGNVLALDVNDY